MCSSKLSISKRSSMSVNRIFMYLPCSVSIMFTKLYLLVTLELLSFILNLLSPTKSLPENFKFVSTLDLMPRFLRLYINDCFCLWHLNLIITLSDLFMLWQACKSSETTWILVSDSALQILSLKHEFLQKQDSFQLSLFYYIEN